MGTVIRFVANYPLDSFAFAVFLTFTLGYHAFHQYMVQRRPDLIFKGKINLVRQAWVAKIFEENTGIVAVQTLRNVTMASSFLATASVILIGGLISLLLSLPETQHYFLARDRPPVTNPVLVLKLVNLIVLFVASLFYFSLCVALLNHIAMLLGAPPQAIREAMGEDAAKFVADLFIKAGRHYTFGMRSVYFLIPAVMWFLGPSLCILSTVAVGFICMKLDFGQVRIL